jgi:hypothetical protein
MKQLQNAAISGRLGQALPVVSEVEIARIERFGERRQYRRGERAAPKGARYGVGRIGHMGRIF